MLLVRSDSDGYIPSDRLVPMIEYLRQAGFATGLSEIAGVVDHKGLLVIYVPSIPPDDLDVRQTIDAIMYCWEHVHYEAIEWVSVLTLGPNGEWKELPYAMLVDGDYQ